MKVALSLEEESHRTFQGGNMRQRPSPGVPERITRRE
jgi:hypothetical protein